MAAFRIELHSRPARGGTLLHVHNDRRTAAELSTCSTLTDFSENSRSGTRNGASGGGVLGGGIAPIFVTACTQLYPQANSCDARMDQGLAHRKTASGAAASCA